MVETVVSSVVGGVLNKKAKSKSSKAAGMIAPKKVDTGASTYDTYSGTVNLDPSIRAMQSDYINSMRGFTDDVGSMYDAYSTGLTGLQGQVDDMRSAYMGNQSEYREAMLNPIRESIARREGDLERELSRTKVRGSFADMQRTNLAMEAGRTLSDAEARIENQRINKLGDFLGMDADILKSSLASDSGRLAALQAIEESIAGISMDRFNQEMQLLRMPSTFIPGTSQAASMTATSEGAYSQAQTKIAGDLIGAAGDYFSNSSNDSFFNTGAENMSDTWENWS